MHIKTQRDREREGEKERDGRNRGVGLKEWVGHKFETGSKK